jgi:hypothetical protein
MEKIILVKFLKEAQTLHFKIRHNIQKKNNKIK